MLEHYRVLDLTDHRGQLAAQIMAGLGADVVLVEPPGGSPARVVGPFAPNAPAPEGSLNFWGYNRGKRSIVVDLATAAGRVTLDDLARRSDVVFTCGPPPVDLGELRRCNPALVTVSISAFGSTGPKADWPATDLTLLAAGGQLILTGDTDRAPVRTSVPQAFLHAAGDAAGGALLALAERSRSGRGQHIDISAQRAVTFAAQSNTLAAPLGAPSVQRKSGGQRVGDIDVQFVWPCKDGHVCVTLLFGPSFGPFTTRLMAWLDEAGYLDDTVRSTDWFTFGELLFGGKGMEPHYERIKQAVGTFCMAHTKEELLHGAVARRALVAPIANTADVVATAQYRARGYWDRVVDENLASEPVRAPGAFVRASGAAHIPLGRAPRLDEHRAEILAEAERGAVGGAPLTASAEARRAPLDGLRVLDLTWALSGPATARHLADFGATVVHVESCHRVDSARTVQPYLHDDPAPENAGVYLNMNAGKLGLSLNLSTAAGHEVLDDLVAWADVLVESFSPRGRISLGLDYDRLRQINPRLIMMSSTLFGQDGPLETYAGFGVTGAALAGFYELTGWPDRAPAGPYGAYTDYVSPRFGLCVLLAALEHRDRTGEGQYLDFSQTEAAMHFLSPALLDYTVNGHIVTRQGNDDDVMAPHGVYPCVGDDRWVAVACRDDAEWRALAAMLGRPDLVELSAGDRRARRAELDELMSAWTVERTPCEAEALLIANGVAAHGVQHSPECAEDPQLRHQGHFVELCHAQHGTVTVEGSRILLSETPAVLRRAAPVLGEDTVEVLRGLLGYGDDRIDELRAAAALE